jgi:SAM-dependent methyltransferase
MLTSYHSIIYHKQIPTNQDLWDWVLERIEINFGEAIDNLGREGRVLDLPCGVGFVEHVLIKRGFKRIDAVDGSAEQIRVARERLKEAALIGEGVRFMVSDAIQFLGQARGYDALFMIDFIEHLRKEEAIRVLRLSLQALDQGGRLFLRTPNAETPMYGRFYNDFTHETPFTRSSLEQCLNLAGFDVVSVEFERVGTVKHLSGPLSGFKRCVYRAGIGILGRFLGMPSGAFSENIVCIARRA